jgi:hypothetical protein
MRCKARGRQVVMTRWRWVCVGLAALLAISLGAWLRPAPFPVSAYNRIRLGMTPQEVAVAIGVPPGYQDGIIPMPPRMCPTGKYIRQTGLPSTDLRRKELFLEHWTWEDYWIWVRYDRTGRVVGYYLLEADGETWPGSSPSFFNRLRAWMGI